MAAHAARRLVRMNANLNAILGIEAMCAAQGVEFRTPLRTSTALQNVVTRLRAEVPKIEQDRYMAPSIAAASAMVRARTLCDGFDVPHMDAQP